MLPARTCASCTSTGPSSRIHYLRTIKTSDEIQQDAESAGHVVLIGGSFIATEVAASLTARGKRCTIVMMEEVATSRAFGEEVGRYFHEVLTSNGVEVIGGEVLEAFVGDGRVSAVRTKSGREVEGEVVVVGAGVHPDVRLAEKAGLEVGDGIVCDEAPPDLGRGNLRGRRSVLVPERRARAPIAGGALGRRAPAGPVRGEGDAG